MRKVQNPKSASPFKRDAFSPAKAATIVPGLIDWFAANARDLPWRRTRDPYAIWVSEIMLQQTQVKTVIPYFERWMRELPTVRSLAEASSERIHKLWEGLGYYTRVRNMQRAARTVVAAHAGEFPNEFDAVVSLPGIGRYTAGAICSVAFNQPTPIVDGNVIRVLTRVFGIRGNAREARTRAELWNVAGHLAALAPRHETRVTDCDLVAGACSALNQSLMELGATMCTPRAPRCGLCPISGQCAAFADSCQETLPNLGLRAALTPRRFAALVIERNGRTLVRQRTGNVVNAHLWEFPNVELPLKATRRMVRERLERELGCPVESLRPVGSIRHSITRYRITLEVFQGVLNGALPQRGSGVWKTRGAMAELPFASAHRRIAERVRSRESAFPSVRSGGRMDLRGH